MGVLRALRYLYHEIRGLHEAAYLLAFSTLLAQVLALVRDRVLAHQFGAGETLDLFYAAFRVPDTLYALLASLFSVFVLVPFLDAAAARGQGAVRELLSDLFTVFSVGMLCIGGIVWLGAPYLVTLLYGGFSPEAHETLVRFVRVLLLQPLFLGASNLLGAYVQMRGRFLVYAIAPLLYNVGIILGATVLYPLLGVTGLVWGVVLGALLHLGMQGSFIMYEHMVPRMRVPDLARVRAVVRVSVPRALTLVSQQLVLLALVALASVLAVGSVSSFSLAMNLQAVPLALVGASYSVAAFPPLVRAYRSALPEYRTLLITAVRQIVFLAVPITVLAVLLRVEIVQVALGSGAFDQSAVLLTAAVCGALVLSLAAQGVSLFLVRACYAAGETYAPLVRSIASAFFTVCAALGMLAALREHGVSPAFFGASELAAAELLALAYAYTAGAVLYAALLVVYVERRFGGFVQGVARTVGESCVASCVAGALAYATLMFTADLLPQGSLGALIKGGVTGVVVAGSWALALFLLKSEDGRTLWHTVRHRGALR